MVSDPRTLSRAAPRASPLQATPQKTAASAKRITDGRFMGTLDVRHIRTRASRDV